MKRAISKGFLSSHLINPEIKVTLQSAPCLEPQVAITDRTAGSDWPILPAIQEYARSGATVTSLVSVNNCASVHRERQVAQRLCFNDAQIPSLPWIKPLCKARLEV